MILPFNGGTSSQVTFINEPRISGREADAKHDARKISLVSPIARFVEAHESFRDRPAQISFFHTGISSLVSLIESEDNKLVLKIPLSSHPHEGEGAFFRTWQSAGIRTPHVVEEGVINGRPYLLMEHIEARPLSETMNTRELLENHIFERMGGILSQMHRPEAVGFGRMIEGKPEFGQFGDWLKGADVQKRVGIVREQNLLDETEYGSLQMALSILQSHVGADPRSIYAHYDFSPHHLFTTEPPTVFDPDPMFNHPYLDLARSIVLIAVMEMKLEDASAQIVKGYFSSGEACDHSALHAAIFLQAHLKFSFWHTVGKKQRIKHVCDYLRANKYLLGTP